jgi:hypothetical protein
LLAHPGVHPGDANDDGRERDPHIVGHPTPAESLLGTRRRYGVALTIDGDEFL